MRRQWEQKLGTVIVEGTIAGIPLIISLCAVLSGGTDIEIANLLKVIMFVCSVILLIKHMKKDFRKGNLASLGYIAGFIVWYSYPAFVSLFASYNRLGLFNSDSELIIWTIT